MRLIETSKVALSALRSNKLRSTLTMVGIIVGIFSIISISTVIAMLQTSIEEGVSALGKNTFQIQKWPAVGNGTQNWAEIRNRKDITYDDYTRLKDMLFDAKYVGAEQWNFGRKISFRNKETNPNISVCCATPDAFPNNDWYAKEGRAVNQNDVDRAERVICLGSSVAELLFEFEDPIGKEVKMDGNKFRVIGVMDSKAGGMFGRDQGNDNYIPITTMQALYGDTRSINITVSVDTKEEYDDVILQAEGAMRTIRKVPPAAANDFDIYSNESVLMQINEMTEGVRLGAYVIGLIALLAAGVGIMNIMLVSVTERTREIGIRKAIGARRRNILVQFLVEAITLCLLGGIVGIIFGLGAGNFAGSLLEATATIPMDWVLVGVVLCVIIGVIFGTYPAFKAANLDPIEALRYE
jgi:putative ABC transport system permease protein